MPKRVDHRERREQLVDALMRIAADRGLEAVSLRHVGAEAGVTSGMVQHYFRTKDELMIFALEAVSERVERRADAAVAALGESPPARAVVEALLVEVLPLDEVRRVEGRVVLAFLAYSAARPEVTVKLRENSARLREFVAERIGAEGPAEVDADLAATGLLALVDGVGVQLLGEHYAPETALAVIGTQLDRCFGTALR